MAVYAAAAGVITPKAPFLPASLINQTSFLGVVGLPIQLVRGILGMAIAAAVWGYSRKTAFSVLPEVGEDVKSKYSIQFLLMMLAALTAGWLFTERLGMDADQTTRADILNLAKVAGASLETADMSRLTGSPTDASLPEYTSLRARLIEINQATAHIRWLYLMTQKEGRIVFAVDSVASDNPKHAEPGAPYSRPPQELFTVFAAGQPAVVGPYTYEAASFISAFVPLRDPSTGQVDSGSVQL